MVNAEQSLDAFFNGGLQLAQFRSGHHRGGTDGVLAAMTGATMAAALSRRLQRTVDVLDMGAGSGLIGLGVARSAPETRVILAERDADLAGLCAGNIARNGLEARVRALNVDLLARPERLAAAGLAAESQDLVVTNPPWFAPEAVRASPGAGRRAAHVFDAPEEGAPAPLREDALQAWLRCACRLLRPGGALLVIHRAEALPELLAGMARRFGDIRVRPVAARAGDQAIRVMVGGLRGRRGPFALDAPLALHGPDGAFAAEAARAHAGERLPWGA